MNGEHSDRRRLIGARLRRLRQESGMTQSALADGTVSRNMLSMIESGTARPARFTPNPSAPGELKASVAGEL